MKSSPLETLLLQKAPLFQELQVDLKVEAGQAHSSPEASKDMILLELFDGVSCIPSFLLERTHSHGSIQTRSHLDTLQNREITGLHIHSARICLYRKGNGLCPILYISQYHPIQTQAPGNLSQKAMDVQDMPRIKQWLSSLGKCDQETFLSGVYQDDFWDCYIHHLEPCLQIMLPTYNPKKLNTIPLPYPVKSNQLSSPVLSSSSTPSTTFQSFSSSPSPRLPPAILKSCRKRNTPDYSALSHNFPTLTWQGIQKHIQDTFVNGSIEDDLFMDSYVSLPNAIYLEKTETAPEINTQSLYTTDDLPSQSSATATRNTDDDWWTLFMTINAIPNQADQVKILNSTKMEMWMIDSPDLIIE
ncbi:hypothetical protein BC941DRAFT_511804 [Chlamydoabsidia padenii]|nr:hypothetical protein BC941DRAFT_511804 [Chlamydoabsidia padenii]